MSSYRNTGTGVILTPANEDTARILASDPAYEELRPAACKSKKAAPKGGGNRDDHSE